MSGRNLEARKEQREQAWQIDGWAETVSKVSLQLGSCYRSELVGCTDSTTRENDGLFHTPAAFV